MIYSGLSYIFWECVGGEGRGSVLYCHMSVGWTVSSESVGGKGEEG